MTKQIEPPTPARLYCLAGGAILALVGIVGFFYNAEFSSGDAAQEERGELLGVMAVNGWANLLHLVAGLAGLVAGGYAARPYSLANGALYTVIAIWGLIIGTGHSVAGVIAIDAVANVFHLAVGVLGLAAWSAWRPTPGGPAPPPESPSAGSSASRPAPPDQG